VWRAPLLERAFRVTLAVAFLLHVPLLPLRVFDWVRISLFGAPADYDDPDAGAIIPIDLDLQARDLVAEAPPPAPPPPPPKPVPAPVGEGLADAGASPPKHPAEPPGPRPLVDPVSAAGGAGKIAAKDPNIQILFAGNVLRKHAIGPWAAGLLVKIPEWREFFEGSPVDPIRDLDHLLITAPRFKGDTSKLVAVMDLNLSPDLAREAVDQMLRRTNGVWLEDTPVPAARARVGGAPRLFALVPERRLLVVMPADAMDQLDRLKHSKGFRNSSEGVVVSMLTPARPFKPFFPLPETLKWLRLALTPTGDGGADLAFDAGDRSHVDAEAHAAVLTREIEARRKIDILGLASMEIVGPVTFAAEGDVIRARTHLPPQKLQLIMDWVAQSARDFYEHPQR
jgi:hypothetical protein